MNPYALKHQEIQKTNQMFQQIRNPEAQTQNIIRIQEETNEEGKIPLVHTYKEKGSIYHKSYDLSRNELKQFIQDHQDTEIVIDNITPTNPGNTPGVELESAFGNFPRVPEVNPHANFQPMDSFKTSFDEKYACQEGLNQEVYSRICPKNISSQDSQDSQDSQYGQNGQSDNMEGPTGYQRWNSYQSVI